MTDTALVAGIDISTKAIDAVLLPLDLELDRPVLVRRFSLDSSAMRKARQTMRVSEEVGRLRAMRGILRQLLDNPYGPVDEVAVERPFSGRSFQAAVPLAQVLGAITASVPIDMHVVWLGANEWRRELGAVKLNSKALGHDAVRPHVARLGITQRLDEHQLDALGIALAHRQLVAKANL